MIGGLSAIGKCDECNSPFCYDRRENGYFCKCGYEYEGPQIDYGSDVRNFEGQNDRSHNGPAQSALVGDSKGSVIARTYNESPANRKLRQTQEREGQEKTKRSIQKARNELRGSVNSKLNLPTRIQESIMMKFITIANEGKLAGRSVDIILGAVIYGECRLEGVSRTMDEIADATGTHTRDLNRAFTSLKRDLPQLGFRDSLPSDPKEYVDRFSSNLNLPPSVIAAANRILTEISGGFVGKSPVTLSVAAIYKAAKELNVRVLLKDLATVSGITEVTIRKTAKQIDEYLASKQNMNITGASNATHA